MELSSESRVSDKHVVIYSSIQLGTVACGLLPFLFGSLLVSSCTRAVRWICLVISISQAVCSMLGLLGRRYTHTHHRMTPWRNLQRKLKSLAQGFGILVISTFVFFELSVLFGAPFTSLLEETTAFAILLTVLSTLPGCLVWGVNPNIWAKVLLGTGPETTYEKSVLHVGIFSIMGAWLGAFPIPLDWDRPWQIWPISCSIGAMLGYIAGNIYNLYCHYKKMQHKRRKRR